MSASHHFDNVPYPSVMVALPAYNEERSVGDVISVAKKYAHLVLVVNDSSKDNTAKAAEDAGALVITHETNQGYGGAALTIFKTAQKYQPDILILLDADGQHDPMDIPKFVAKIMEGYDVVIGSRYLDQKSQDMIPLYRKMGMRALDTATRTAAKNLETTDVLCGYRAFSKKAYSEIHHLDPTYHGCTDIIIQLSDLHMRFGEVSINVRYDLEDTSAKTPVGLGLNLLGGIIQTISIKRPLLFFGLPGFVIAVIGAVLSYQALVITAELGSWPPTLTLTAMMMLLMGMLLVITALILFSISALMRK